MAAALGLLNLRTFAQRLLTLIALALILPVLLSPANSPRNLTTGTVFLLMLAADRVTRWAAKAKRPRRLRAGAEAALAAIAVCGLSSLAALTGALPTARRPGLQSSAVPLLVEDAAGWDAIADALAGHDGMLYTIDYSLAGQIRYYTGRPTLTSWPQYRHWGVPPLTDVTVIAADYLPVNLLTARLAPAFEALSGPERMTLASSAGDKTLWIWDGAGLKLDTAAFLDDFDFLTLYESLP
jgi:hypothetical protein